MKLRCLPASGSKVNLPRVSFVSGLLLMGGRAGWIGFLSCSACTWPWPRPPFSSPEPTPCSAWCSPAAGLQAARMRWAPEWSEHAKGVGASMAVEGRRETQLNNQFLKLEAVVGAQQARSACHSLHQAASPLLVPLPLALQVLWRLGSFL